VERRYFGRTLPAGRVVAMRDEVGVQARVLPPGLQIMVPFVYVGRKTDMLMISEDEVGILESIDGLPLEPGRIFARHVEGHDTFQDGEAFLRNGGQKGPQIDILPPGQYRINTYLFTIRAQPVVTISKGQVGVVSARDGDPITPGRLLARKVQGHQAFQDGEAFLRAGGQRGPQYDLLKPGTYYINPLMFDVQLDKVAIVQRGEVAVLVSNVGKEPEDIPHEERLSGRERYVVPAGFRGIQSEV